MVSMVSKKLVWVVVAVALMFLPGIISGCAEISDATQSPGLYTLGPGNMEDFRTPIGSPAANLIDLR